jgi:drug/metabolite transporter (DMT)-like permease
MAGRSQTDTRASPGPTPGWLLAAGTLTLFLFWSQSFIAIEALLVPEDRAPRFDWLSLTSARFALVAAIAAAWLGLFRRSDTIRVLRAHWRRVLLAGLFCVPGYNLALYWGQEQRVAAPIASLLTTLAPLFVMLLSALFLSERITARRGLGFVIALTGVILIARSRESPDGAAYPLLIGVTALGPLSWSFFTVISKPVTGRVPPLVWTYLCIIAGTIPTLCWLPFRGLPEMLALDGTGWLYLSHLVLLCTVLGFALWVWLLSRLPATSVGFTIFLNPPMTTIQKVLLAALFPAAFAFTVTTGEVVGGLVMLAGVGVATLGRVTPARRNAAPPSCRPDPRGTG